MDSTLLAGIMGLIGAFIGGLFSYFGTKSATKDNINAQNEIIQRNKLLEEQKGNKFIETNIKIIYLDLLTALHQGFLFLKRQSIGSLGNVPPLLPMSQNYSSAISSINHLFTGEELVLINKAYGMIEKVRFEIMNTNYLKDIYSGVEFSYDILENVVFKENYSDIMSLDASMITKDYLLTKLSPEYFRVFEKLKKYGNIN